MKTIVLPLVILLLTSTMTIHAQVNVEFTKENMKNDRTLRNVYKAYVKKGDHLCYNYERGYLVALEYYLMAYERHPNSALLNYKIANCYLHTLYKYKALPYMLKACELKPNVMCDADYLMGLAYHKTGNFDQAIANYQKFRNTYTGADPDTIAMVTRRIQECNNGKELQKENPYEIVNLGSEINSEYAEYVPIIKADQHYMLFTSRRPQKKIEASNSSKKIKGERLSKFDLDYHEDIFKTEHLNDSTWSAPSRFEYSTNKNTLHDACISVSFDGSTIYNYRGDNNGDLYTCKKENDKWTKTVPLKGINTKYREDHIAVSNDNQTVYFLSDRPGGLGGKDIWKSEMNGKGEWSKPENLGAPVNTEYDEDGVFIHPDGKTIYFSSRGHNTMGGYDIFESTLENGVWSEPLNLGIPVNSPDDDVFFTLTSDGQTAYLSSVKESGFGMQDIYTIRNFDKKKNRKTETIAFKAHVIDKKTKKQLISTITILDNSSGTIVYTGSIGSEQDFVTPLSSSAKGISYHITVAADGYLAYSEDIELKNTETPEYEKTIEMDAQVAVNDIAFMDKLSGSIYYDYRKTKLRDESAKELDKILEVLNIHTDLKIELEGHADNLGWSADNQLLSEQRVEAAKKYLVSKGLKSDRIIKWVGYGETKPANSNETEEGRKNNRRVDFRLVK